MKLDKSVTKSVERLMELAHMRDELETNLTKVEKQMGDLIKHGSVASAAIIELPQEENTKNELLSGLRKSGKKIVNTLVKAGDKGLTVQELASKINSKPANLYAWFFARKEKIPGLHKNGHRYVLTANN